MDSSRSDFGHLPAVSQMVDRISAKESELVINRSRDGRDLAIRIPLDGSARENDILGVKMNTEAHWDGEALVVNFSGTRRPVSYKERWTLAPDGKSFRVARHLTSPRGETDQTLTMERQ